jgi:hypothetical protein
MEAPKLNDPTSKDLKKIQFNRNDPESWAEISPRTQGRKAAAAFEMHPGCPLAKSHYLIVNAKQTLVVMAGGKPPDYPIDEVPDLNIVPIALQRRRDSFAAYAVANYWSWSATLPPSIPSCTRWPQGKIIRPDWAGFCILLDYLYDCEGAGPGFIHRGRLMEIENLCHGTREHPVHGALVKKLVTKYRCGEADDLRNKKKLNPYSRSGSLLVDDVDGRVNDNAEITRAARDMIRDIMDVNQVNEQVLVFMYICA